SVRRMALLRRMFPTSSIEAAIDLRENQRQRKRSYRDQFDAMIHPVHHRVCQPGQRAQDS
ncbi:MAG: hypothetical protein R3174_12315, partial [Gammaproteobacteria bacterium]|nr:hypothetical protein [Gammaproteobacteria bacterium]